MPNIALSKPFENIDNLAESRVLAVIEHLMPSLSKWRAGEDLRKILEASQHDLTEFIADIKESQKEVTKLRQEEQAIKTRTPGLTTYLSIGVSIIIAGGVVAIEKNIPIAVGIVLIGIALGIFTHKLGKKNALDIHQQKIVNEESKTATATKKADDQKRAIDALGRELKERTLGFPEIALAEIRFPLKTTEINNQAVLIDMSGAHGTAQLVAVDISTIDEGLEKISETVDRILSAPPLLSPNTNEEEVDPMHQLYGEESELQNLVRDYTKFLGSARNTYLNLPLVEKDSILNKRLTNGEYNNVFDAPGIGVIDASVPYAKINEFNERVAKSGNSSSDVENKLKATFANLDMACGLYAKARIDSINTVHHNLIEVLERASWCNRRFYCPRTILAPLYLQDLLKIELKNAHLLSIDDLIERLNTDTEIARRLSDGDELMDLLTDSYEAVQLSMGPISLDENGNAIDRGNRSRHIESQHQETVKRFRHILQRVMTGSIYPTLNFSAESQLFYDPDNEEWSSEVAPYVYTSADAFKYGGMIKAYTDVMVPMWEYLWTEKADFRKSELFRTNESMIRMSEKESEKLIEIANQFRADMRSVRENVYNIKSEMKSKETEIISFRDGMDLLGLLSVSAKANLTDEKLQSIILGEGTDLNSDNFEMVLANLPKIQADNRGSVKDPIDMIKEPDALIRIENKNSIRLLPT
jgi:hypothetical protein